jgi:hypothetical protein
MTAGYLEQHHTFMKPIHESEQATLAPTRITSYICIHRHCRHLQTQANALQQPAVEAMTLPALPPTVTTPPTHIRMISWTSNLTKGNQQLDKWYQRMGHPPPTVFQGTQKVKPYCSLPILCQGKATQSSERQGRAEQCILTWYHVSHGPRSSRLRLRVFPPCVSDSRWSCPRNPTIVKSIDCHSSYLSFIDTITRYIWVFPLKSKHPPIELIDKFLSRYGNKHPH